MGSFSRIDLRQQYPRNVAPLIHNHINLLRLDVNQNGKIRQMIARAYNVTAVCFNQ